MSEQKTENKPEPKIEKKTSDNQTQESKDLKTANDKKDLKAGRSMYAKKANFRKKRTRRREEAKDEFEQKILDLARVTRVMAGGKRMSFRACVGVGNLKGQIGLGMAKGADVTIAVNKAVAQAKKDLISVPIDKEGSIPHEIRKNSEQLSFYLSRPNQAMA